MKQLKWLIYRLKAMGVLELAWRMQQKTLQKIEYIKYYIFHLPVTEIPLTLSLKNKSFDMNRININWDNPNYDLFKSINIFDEYDYKQYKIKWNAGFQTENVWPEMDFSYNISIGQRQDIGDIRTNWELNRHFQFVGLAKNYYITGNQTYLIELRELFYDWNKKNLFLHGVQWTSAMEIAIRTISWIYMYCFLEKGFQKQEMHRDQRFLEQALHGIKVMAKYIVQHRSRFTSANNHLIVEMLGVGVAGILLNYQRWIDLSVNILTDELPKQNSPDGVNKEMSLHYQCFVMEAYGILWLLLNKNDIPVPDTWKNYLTHMSEFLADCCGDYSEVIIFGDNDEGKIIDFYGKIDDYYRYVLQLMGILLDCKYTDINLIENIYWLVGKEDIDKYCCKKIYYSELVQSYKKGGYTILRSWDHKVLIGIDHGELGFGNLAAHGHADALSIQVFFEGVPILVDSGTYNYHVPATSRNEYRRTVAHNTVYAKYKEQADILGPFLWGKRYTVELKNIDTSDKNISIQASVDYKGMHHLRQISFDFYRNITVKDSISNISPNFVQQLWHFANLKNIEIKGGIINSNRLLLSTDSKLLSFKEYHYSPTYGHVQVERLGVIGFVDDNLITNIKIL
ncbi:alginate lyase family protein [Eubacterium ventriosum]|uniref:alginate lyase family protein n=1 Tax=Eubacterium ventriosum TaxID=39496 RepID=UPI003AB19A6C